MAVDPGLGRDQSETRATAPPSHDVNVIPTVEGPAAAATGRSINAPICDRDEDDNVADEEGGVRAWLAILGSFLVYFASFGVANSFGYFQTFYQTEYLQQYSPSVISLIGTIQITLLYLTGSIAGALFDAYGLKVSPIQGCMRPNERPLTIAFFFLFAHAVASLPDCRSGRCRLTPRNLIHPAKRNMAAISRPGPSVRPHRLLWRSACARGRRPVL